jgi:hypothetical protein
MDRLRRLSPVIFPAILTAGLVLLIAACGKRGEPSPPADQPTTYPRAYPSE